MMDPIKLQRLVDGELAPNEFRELLEVAETSPVQWREIAIGFLEDQQFQTGFQDATEGHANLDDERLFPNIQSPSKRLPESPTIRATGFFSRGPVSVAGLAAGLLVAVAIGFLAGQSFTSGDGLRGIAKKPAAQFPTGAPSATAIRDSLAEWPIESAPDRLAQAGEVPEETLVSYRPDYHLELHDQYGNPVMDSQIPLLKYENAKKLGYSLNRSFVSREARERFTDSGYLLNEDIQYISGRLADGRRFVLPVRTISLSPGQ